MKATGKLRHCPRCNAFRYTVEQREGDVTVEYCAHCDAWLIRWPSNPQPPRTPGTEAHQP